MFFCTQYSQKSPIFLHVRLFTDHVQHEFCFDLTGGSIVKPYRALEIALSPLNRKRPTMFSAHVVVFQEKKRTQTCSTCVINTLYFPSPLISRYHSFSTTDTGDRIACACLLCWHYVISVLIFLMRAFVSKNKTEPPQQIVPDEPESWQSL